MRKKTASKTATATVKRKYTGTTAEQFVTAWQQAENIDDVVKATGMTASSARARCFAYRKIGIKLKRFAPSARTKIDVAALNKLAKASAK